MFNRRDDNRDANRTEPNMVEPNLVERGFTLVELLIVIVILGILAGIVVFAVGNLTSNAKTKGCAAERTTIMHALESYKAYTGVYPTATAAGGGSHKAMDLLTGNATTTPTPGVLLKTVPVLYDIDNAGVLSPTAAGVTATCP